MRVSPFVSAVTVAAFLTATMPISAVAQSAPISRPTSFRASIERAADQAAQTPAPAKRTTPVRREMQMMGGGGGGGGQMFMMLIMTAVSLAGTYYLVKELKKTNDDAAKAAQ